jgi:hypothetical protein
MSIGITLQKPDELKLMLPKVTAKPEITVAMELAELTTLTVPAPD